MLGKMLIHGLVGALAIGAAAAVFAQAKDGGAWTPATELSRAADDLRHHHDD